MTPLFTPQQLKTILSSFLFRNVDEIFAEQLISDNRCRRESYPRGGVIYDETHFRRCLGILLSGEVLVEKGPGKRLHMARLYPGDIFGAAALFQSRSGYPSLITAKKPTEVLFLPQEVLTWAMQRNQTITENYISYLSDRIWFLSSRISALTAGTAERQLAVFLLERGSMDVSMTDLSQQLNIGRASLYRALETLEDLGAIARNGKSVEVLREDVLRELIAG